MGDKGVNGKVGLVKKNWLVFTLEIVSGKTDKPRSYYYYYYYYSSIVKKMYI